MECSGVAELESDHRAGGGLLTRWGIRPAEEIPQMGEVIPSQNGDGVFTGREPYNTQESNENRSNSKRTSTLRKWNLLERQRNNLA